MNIIKTIFLSVLIQWRRIKTRFFIRSIQLQRIKMLTFIRSIPMSSIKMLFLLLFFSCEESIEWKTEHTANNYIVVESIITNENRPQTVKISHSVTELNASALPVSNAEVTLDDEDSTFVLHEINPPSGIYQTDTNLIGVVGKEYHLTVSYQNKTFHATCYMVPVTPFEPLTYQKSENGLYQLTWVNKIYDDIPAMWEVSLDWSHVTGYETLDSSLTKAKLYYYTFSSIDVSQVFAPQKETILFPKGTVITEKKYSLTAEHAAFFRALLSETQWRGGVFDVEAANLPTNLSKGAVGFFGASTVITDTLIVE